MDAELDHDITLGEDTEEAQHTGSSESDWKELRRHEMKVPFATVGGLMQRMEAMTAGAERSLAGDFAYRVEVLHPVTVKWEERGTFAKVAIIMEGRYSQNPWHVAGHLRWTGDKNAKPIRLGFPVGYDMDSLGDITAGRCDHCGLQRDRQQVAVVEDCEGNRRVVGSSCLEDFIGPRHYELLWLDKIWEVTKGWDRVQPTNGWSYRMADLAAVAAARIRTEGFVSVSSTQELPSNKRRPVSTKERLVEGLKSGRTYVPTHRDVEHAEQVLEWARQQADSKEEYYQNLAAVATNEIVDLRGVGLVCSMFPAYDRAQEWEAKRLREQENKANLPPAPEGRMEVSGKVERIWVGEREWGMQMRAKVVTEEGWATWVTVPAKARGGENGWEEGKEVSFSATLTRSEKDPTTANAKRPRLL